MNISVSPFDEQHFMTAQHEMVKMPIKFRHWLGTNHKGEDVLAAVIYGCRHSLAVGLFSMILAGVIGVLLGMIAGYYQNHGIQVSLGSLTGGLTGIVPALFYGFVRPSLILPDDSEKEANAWLMTAFISLLIFSSLMTVFVLSGKWLGKKIPFFNKKISIPADSIISRVTEWMNAMPKLFLILILAGLFNKTAIGLVLILGCIQWTGIARIVRAETLSLRQTQWTESAISLGLPEIRIIFRHLFPHILPSFMVVFILGIASSIMAESSLSFLDAGIPDNWISWGTLSGNGKRHLENWWLLAVPGTLLLFTLLGLSVLADHYRRK
jgi:peptide/nickel transport system permease protein